MRLQQIPGIDDSAPIGWWSLYQPPPIDAWGGTLYPIYPFDQYTLPIGGGAVAQALLDGRVLLVGGNALVAQSSTLNPTPTIPLPAPISPLFQPVGFPANPTEGFWT